MSLQSQIFSRQDWLKQMYRKSESIRTEKVAETALHMFDRFCQNEGLTESQMIERYQTLAASGDIRSICLSLDKFVQFLDQDHDGIVFEGVVPMTFKKKSPKTIKTYFAFIRSYLRICHNVKVSNDDVKDYVTFPKIRKEPRKAIPLKTLKLILTHASPQRRALYSVLISSGMRIGEALALEVKDIHFQESPVRVTVRAETTKTKEGRETYISSEAVDKLNHIIEGKKDNQKIFSDLDDISKAMIFEEQAFAKLRKKLELVEKYPNSNRFVVNLHCFRAYFHTKATQKHGSSYAHALLGHGEYLKQYYRETPEERAKKYKELEPDLLIESFKLHTEKTKDKIIESLQLEMKKLQDKMTRIELLNKKD